MRSVRIVASRCASLVRLTSAASALARRKIASVGRPSTASRKWPPSRLSSRHCLRVWSCACQPTSAMNRGISGRVSAMISAESQSASSTTTSTAIGTSTASTSCGR